MSSEQLGAAQNILKGNLGGAWDITNGYQDAYTDLGIARRFGGSAAAYSLRDIGAMNGRVVRVRRDLAGEEADAEEDFSASQVDSGALENWVNGKLESTLPADVATAAAAYSLRKVKASYASNAVRIRRSSDDAEVNVAFDSDDKVSTSSDISVVSGTVTANTLGDFISGTDAFVHTWYDQAGSNNAVQETSANQPKIAENGALLADANGNATLDFPNTSATDTHRLGTDFVGTNINSLSAYCVCKSDNTNTLGAASFSQPFTQGTYASDERFFIAIDKDETNWHLGYGTGLTDLGTAVTTNQTLFSINAGTNVTSNINSVPESTASSQDNALTRSSSFIGGHTSTDAPWDGTISELIYYTSDQTNNRFKIESNINNYYGLYNDANEVTGAFTASGQDSFTANGTDGFTLGSATADAFAGIELNEKVPDNDIIYISFNADLSVTGTASPTVALRKTSISGTVSSDSPSSGQPAVIQGFNSFGLVCSDADAKFVTFLEDANNVAFTISDFRVSRIERNGFVPTWYDQSTSGNNAVQGTANKQPKIVSNGGTHKLEGLPAINFDDATSHCLTSSNYSRSGSDLPLSMMAVFDKSTTDTDYLFAANKSDDDAFQRLLMRSTSFEYGERDDSNTFKAGNGGSPSLNTIFLMSAFTGGTTSSAFVNGSSVFSDVDTDLGTQTFDQIDIGANNGDGASSNNPFSGNISELYLFETNLSTDRTTIEEEIANHYNITLS